jgi:hypothetical protein
MWKNKEVNGKREKNKKICSEEKKEKEKWIKDKKEDIEARLKNIDKAIETCDDIEKDMELHYMRSLIISTYNDIKEPCEEEDPMIILNAELNTNGIIASEKGFDDIYNAPIIEVCENCNEELTKIPTEGILMCERCCEIKEQIYEFNNIVRDKNYKSSNTLSYKKISHFNDLMAQLQCKKNKKKPTQLEMDEISQDIISSGEKIEKVKPKDIRNILKKKGWNHLYDSIPIIECQLKNISAIVLSMEVRKTLRIIFKELQIAWRKIKPKGKNNFPSYNFVYRKIFQLLELDEYMDYFPLPENKNGIKRIEKLAVYWKQMCEICKFEYINVH